MKNRKMVMHPAWQAAHELLSDPETWFETVMVEGHGYTDAQVATAMRCQGYGADVIVLYEGVRVVGYELPACWIPVNENNTLDAYPRLAATAKMLALPTLEDVLADPAGFAAGFELIGHGAQPLPAGVLAVLNGIKG